jgi:uncharacterized membrane protein YuzA (DUF378 family)
MIQQIVDTVTEIFTGLLSAMSEGVVALFEGLLRDSTTGELTAFAEFAFVIVGLSLAVGVFYTLLRVIKR